ncbi:hypothetical protein EG328_005549 [Venturia inaequalis]|uniref:Uncharacterized protein n=1 Tax=Venturia inaequalis TaxID=5025 RepID=A0A8H3YTL1_VENIN|nr:hypothetical protein EG328_005549 [Venturia inaequalis]
MTKRQPKNQMAGKYPSAHGYGQSQGGQEGWMWVARDEKDLDLAERRQCCVDSVEAESDAILLRQGVKVVVGHPATWQKPAPPVGSSASATVVLGEDRRVAYGVRW